jgi:hypothetical protein
MAPVAPTNSFPPQGFWEWTAGMMTPQNRISGLKQFLQFLKEAFDIIPGIPFVNHRFQAHE